MKNRFIYIQIVLILSLLLIPLSSAMLEVTKNVDVKKGDKLDFNGKQVDYNSIWDKYKPIKIVDNWGIPFISSDKLEGYIDKHDESCGTSCSSSFIIKQYDEKALIEDVRFYTINKDGSRILQDIKSYQFYIKTGENERIVDDYKWVCKENGKVLLNGTKEVDCSYDKIGSHKEYDKIWKKINVGEVYPAGEYEIKLEGVKSEKRTVDWQIKSYVWLEDWAVWNATVLTTNLLAYYKFDEGTGTEINDSLGRYNTNYSTAQYWQPGKINNSFRSDGLDADGSQTYINITGQQNMTVSFWINKSGSETDGGIFTFDNCGETGEFGIYMTTDRINVCTQSQNLNGWTPRASIWEHYVVTVNSTTIASYVNGVYNESMAVSNFKFATSTGKPGFFLFIGGGGGGSSLENVGVDEMGIWNRTLNLVDVQSLYNSGNGLPYSSFPNAAGTVTLNSPDNNYNTTTSSINFNCSASITGGATLVNISLWDNSTGTFGLRETISASGTSKYANFTKSYNIGNYLWNCQACDSDGDCGFAWTNRSFNIKSLSENSATYSATALETSTQTFILNVTKHSSISSVTAYLNYSGILYPSTTTSSGDNILISNSISIPAGTGVKNFSWKINLFGTGGNYNVTSNSYNQTIAELLLYNCTSGGLTLNFTTYDTSTSAPLNSSFEGTFSYSAGSGTVKNFSYSSINESKSNWQFCINSAGLNATVNAFISYYSTGYDRREYIISNGIIGNFTQNIPLYLTSNTLTDVVTFTVNDENYNPITGALVTVQQWNIGTNTFYTIGQFTTSSSGNGIMDLILYNIWYRAIVSVDGNIVATTDVQKLSGTTWNIIVESVTDNPYELFGTISHGLTFDNSTNITTFTWLDNSGYTQKGCLEVDKHTNLGWVNIYSSCVSSVSGTINYQLTNESYEYSIKGIIYLTPVYNVSEIIDTLNVQMRVPELTEQVSSYGKVLSFIVIGTAGLVGVSLVNPLVGAFAIFFSIFLCVKLGWMNMTMGIISGFVTVLIIVMFRMSKRSG